MEEQVKTRKKWSRAEVLGLLSCYAARKEEFTHFRRQKTAYQNVLEDMIYQGITDSSTTADTLKNKIRTLLDANKSAKDNMKKTGAAPVVVPYMTELDEIFGDKPIVSNNHTLHLGLPTKEKPSQEIIKSFSPEDFQETSSSEEYTQFEALEDETISVTTTSPLTCSSPSTAPVVSFEKEVAKTKNIRKRKSARENYFEARLNIKREAMEAEKTQRAHFLNSVQENLREKWQRESEHNNLRLEMLKTIQKNIKK